jgi:Tfp pilus assembly protein PilF
MPLRVALATIKSMATNRLDALKQMVAQDEKNSFARYGLAMEYSGRGEFEEALKQFKTLIATDQTYVAAYYHGGQALEKTGKVDEARRMYEQGLEACQKTGDLHTRAEIEAALNLLPI